LIDLPIGLDAHPFFLTGRFLFAVLVPYAIAFAAAAGTIRTTAIVLGALLGVPLLAVVGLDFISNFTDALAWLDLSRWIQEAVFGFGPLRVLTGSWMLIDV
jgi:hypothetical protein